MQIFEFLSSVAIPVIILLVIIYGLIEKQKVYDVFLDGAKEGIEVVFKIFPTLIGVFVAIGALRSSGVLDLIINFISPISNMLNIPKEIMPLAMLRSISGSASMAVATDMFNMYGVDSKLGLMVATIMGSTETTLYVIAVYSGCVGIKKTKFVLPAALIADAVGIVCAVAICRILL